MHLVVSAIIPLGDAQAMSKPSAADTLFLHSFKFKCVIQWRPLIIIVDNVINRLLLSKSVVPKYSI